MSNLPCSGVVVESVALARQMVGARFVEGDVVPAELPERCVIWWDAEEREVA